MRKAKISLSQRELLSCYLDYETILVVIAYDSYESDTSHSVMRKLCFLSTFPSTLFFDPCICFMASAL